MIILISIDLGENNWWTSFKMNLGSLLPKWGKSVFYGFLSLVKHNLRGGGRKKVLSWAVSPFWFSQYIICDLGTLRWSLCFVTFLVLKLSFVLALFLINRLFCFSMIFEASTLLVVLVLCTFTFSPFDCAIVSMVAVGFGLIIAMSGAWSFFLQKSQ